VVWWRENLRVLSRIQCHDPRWIWLGGKWEMGGGKRVILAERQGREND